MTRKAVAASQGKVQKFALICCRQKTFELGENGGLPGAPDRQQTLSPLFRLQIVWQADSLKESPMSNATVIPSTTLPTEGFVRLPQVLAAVPVSKSTWWAGCKTGRFPAPVKLGPRTTAWRVSDIRAMLDNPASCEL